MKAKQLNNKQVAVEGARDHLVEPNLPEGTWQPVTSMHSSRGRPLSGVNAAKK
jgi:hypothetical protein